MSGEIRFHIVGNFTADPELRFTQNGVPVASFTIASTPWEQDRATGKGKDGEPVFMRCSAWRELAEHIAASLTKGTRVVAFGRYRQRRYQTEEGQHRTSHEFEVEAIGPDLRWATAVVSRKKGSSPASSPASSDGGGWHAPASTTADPWADEEPF